MVSFSKTCELDRNVQSVLIPPVKQAQVIRLWRWVASNKNLPVRLLLKKGAARAASLKRVMLERLEVVT